MFHCTRFHKLIRVSSLFQYWDVETSDSREVPQESEESDGRRMMDYVICSLIAIIRTLFGYFPAPPHPHLRPNASEF
jgi:hypothetical protein